MLVQSRRTPRHFSYVCIRSEPIWSRRNIQNRLQTQFLKSYNGCVREMSCTHIARPQPTAAFYSHGFSLNVNPSCDMHVAPFTSFILPCTLPWDKRRPMLSPYVHYLYIQTVSIQVMRGQPRLFFSSVIQCSALVSLFSYLDSTENCKQTLKTYTARL